MRTGVAWEFKAGGGAVVGQGPNSIETFWLEFQLGKSLEIPYTKEMFKNG